MGLSIYSFKLILCLYKINGDRKHVLKTFALSYYPKPLSPCWFVKKRTHLSFKCFTLTFDIEY